MNMTEGKEMDIFSAICEASIEKFTTLINEGLDLNFKFPNVQEINNEEYKNAVGQTPLHFTVYKMFIPAIDLLLGKDVDVNIKNKEGNTPLHVAVSTFFSDDSVVEKLLGKGADIDATNEFNQTPLLLSIELGNLNAFKSLLQRGADVNLRDRFGYSLLHCTIRKQYDEQLCASLVNELIIKGADVNPKDNKAYTPLDAAVQGHYSSIVKSLLEEGVEVSFLTLESSISYYDHSKFEESQTIMQELLNWCRLRDDTNDHVKQFLHEVEAMENYRLGNYSLYDVLLLYNDPTYVRSASLVNFLKSYNLIVEFPIYSQILKDTFSKAKIRYGLINNTQDLSIAINLLPEVFRIILSFLNNEDLINVQTALSL